MNDTIRRESVIAILEKNYCAITVRNNYRDVTDDERRFFLSSREDIKKLPSEEPERKRGKWIPVTNGRGGFECDRCHCYAPSYQDGVEWLSAFCPNCGADMRGERNDG